MSYLVARLSRDLLVAAHRQITQDWWAAPQGSVRLLCFSGGH